MVIARKINQDHISIKRTIVMTGDKRTDNERRIGIGQGREMSGIRIVKENDKENDNASDNETNNASNSDDNVVKNNVRNNAKNKNNHKQSNPNKTNHNQRSKPAQFNHNHRIKHANNLGDNIHKRTGQLCDKGMVMERRDGIGNSRGRDIGNANVHPTATPAPTVVHAATSAPAIVATVHKHSTFSHYHRRFRFDSPPKSDQSDMSDDPEKMDKLNRMKAEK